MLIFMYKRINIWHLGSSIAWSETCSCCTSYVSGRGSRFERLGQKVASRPGIPLQQLRRTIADALLVEYLWAAIRFMTTRCDDRPHAFDGIVHGCLEAIVQSLLVLQLLMRQASVAKEKLRHGVTACEGMAKSANCLHHHEFGMGP